MSDNDNKMFIFSGTGHPVLAKNIASVLGIELGKIKIERFPDGEIFVQLLENVRGHDVFIIQPTCFPVNENIMELLIILDAARRASAGRITAVIPYYGYARQDRKDRPRVPITAKLVANILVAAGVNRILTMDLHAQQIMGFFDIPVDHLYGAPVLISYLKERLGPDAVVVSPDSGSVKMAHHYSNNLNAGLAVIAKRRKSATTVESSHLVGDVADRNCLIIDDISSTASTLIIGEKLLRKEGAKTVMAAVSHCLLTEEGIQRIMKSGIEELVTTDSISSTAHNCEKIKVLSIASLFGEAIRRIHTGGSLSSLFRMDGPY